MFNANASKQRGWRAKRPFRVGHSELLARGYSAKLVGVALTARFEPLFFRLRICGSKQPALGIKHTGGRTARRTSLATHINLLCSHLCYISFRVDDSFARLLQA